MSTSPSLNFNKALRPAFKQLLGKHRLVGAEIGVYRGNNAYNYLRDLDISLVYLIDPYRDHKDYDEPIHTDIVLKLKGQQAQILLKKYSHKIIWVKEKSADVINKFKDESLDFVYIDGNHLRPFVLEDMILYYPKVKKGGLLCGHDYKKGQPNYVFGAVTAFCKMTGIEFFHELPDWWIKKELK